MIWFVDILSRIFEKIDSYRSQEHMSRKKKLRAKRAPFLQKSVTKGRPPPSFFVEMVFRRYQGTQWTKWTLIEKARKWLCPKSIFDDFLYTRHLETCDFLYLFFHVGKCRVHKKSSKIDFGHNHFFPFSIRVVAWVPWYLLKTVSPKKKRGGGIS